MGIEYRIEVRVVVHLHLPVELEAAFAGEHLGPEIVEAGGEILALLDQDGEAIAVAGAVLRTGGVAVGFFGGVIDLEREDGEPVDDEAGGFGVERSLG